MSIDSKGLSDGEVLFECDEETMKSIGACEIIDYQYELTVDDKLGNNYYDIKLLSKKAEGSHEDFE